jgi:hypothetical protein
MVRSAARAALLFLTTIVVVACGRPIDAVGTACGDDRDCSLGEVCSGGICNAGGLETCVTDLDCDPSADEVCNNGICAPSTGGPAGSGGACTETASCPIDTFCNTAIGSCTALLDGWCRTDTQCGAASPLCSNAAQGPSVPGRCVECLGDSDCGGSGTCQAPGICVVENACPANASPVVGGTCRCNAGFADDGAGGCAADPTDPDPVDPDPTDPTDPTDPDPTDPDPTDPVNPGPSPTTPGTGQSCAQESDCFETVGFEYTCEQDECVCDVPFLLFFCDAVDEQLCDCAGSSTEPTSTLNDDCIDDTDCGSLSCIYGAGADPDFDFGSCKRRCGSDSDCSSLGLECMEDVLGSAPAGICADVREVGETCETSIWTDDLSSNAICTGSASADIVDCFSSRCEEVCNWAGKTGGPLACSSGSCGSLQFRVETGRNVAVCQ